MNTKNTNNSLFQKDQLKASLKQSFVKLNPRLMVKTLLCSQWKSPPFHAAGDRLFSGKRCTGLGNL